MHVGWAVTLQAPADGPRPSFEQLRDHLAGRLAAAPSYRQRLAGLPLRIWEPAWIDDPEFEWGRHILPAVGSTFTEMVDRAMSSPLDRDLPLWNMWVAPELPDGRVGYIGKAHHGMVDGLAALELVGLLFDLTPEAEPTERDTHEPRRPPSRRALGAEALRDMGARLRAVARSPVALARSGIGFGGAAASLRRMGAALLDCLRPAPTSSLNGPSSPQRHHTRTHCSLQALRTIKEGFDTSLNDVVLAVAAGALRRHAERRGESPRRLKSIVPINVRDPSGDSDDLGNQLSFMWIDLPCHEPDPVRRLEAVHADTSLRKVGLRAEATSAIVTAAAHGPRFVKALLSWVFAHHRTANLIVSNLIGPPTQLFMLGCELEEIYPIVPLTHRHALSIGLISVGDRACFSLYSDAQALPDADLLAEDIQASVAELVARAEGPSVTEAAARAVPEDPVPA